MNTGINHEWAQHELTKDSKKSMTIPVVPKDAKLPQEDFIDELIKLREDLKAITIDGPSGIHFKRVIDKLLAILIDKL